MKRNNAHQAPAEKPTHDRQDLPDWHQADIVAALRKAGWTLRRLSVHHGYVPQQLWLAIARPWPKGETLIASAIGVPPEQIWPSRYAKRREREANLRPATLARRARRLAVSGQRLPSTSSLDGAAQSAKGDF